MSILAQFITTGTVPENTVSSEDLDFQDMDVLVGQINRLRAYRNQMTRILYSLLEQQEETDTQLNKVKREIMSVTEGGTQMKNQAVSQDESYTELKAKSSEISTAISIVQNEISVANTDIQLCRSGMYNKELRGGVI